MPVGVVSWLVNAAFFLMLVVGVLVFGGLLFTSICSLYRPSLTRFEFIMVAEASDLRNEVDRRLEVLLAASETHLQEFDADSFEVTECGESPALFRTSRDLLPDGLTRISVAGAQVLFRTGLTWSVWVAADGFDLGPGGTRTPISDFERSEIAMDVDTSPLYKIQSGLSA